MRTSAPGSGLPVVAARTRPVMTPNSDGTAVTAPDVAVLSVPEALGTAAVVRPSHAENNARGEDRFMGFAGEGSEVDADAPIHIASRNIESTFHLRADRKRGRRLRSSTSANEVSECRKYLRNEASCG